MTTLFPKNINIKSIIENNDKLLTIKELLTIIDFNIDNLYIDRFWDNIKDDKWIYLDNELILWLGYKDYQRGKEKIINLLKKYNLKDEEYKILNNTEFNINNFCSTLNVEQNLTEEKRGAHNKQYIILTPNCFKELCMHICTSKSKIIKKYYITLETIFKFYLEYQNKYKEYELNKTKNELKDAKDKIVDLSHNIFKFQELNENTFLYVATNKHLSSQNNYKVGVTRNLTLRSINHNNTHNVNDRFYYTYTVKLHNAYIVEYMIKHILYKFKNSDRNEIYIIDHSYLLKLLNNIVENYQNIITYYNNVMKNYTIDTYNTNTYYNSLEEEQYNEFDDIKEAHDSLEEEQYNEFDDIKEAHNYLEEYNESDKTEDTNSSEENSYDESSEIEETNDNNVIYYHNNKKYPYIKFRNEFNRYDYKCLRCDHIFIKFNNLDSHFNRKVKCFEDPKLKRIQDIINQNDTPIVKIIKPLTETIEEDYSNYTYFEKFNKEKNIIEYHCNNCDVVCLKLSGMRDHYVKRKIKCYNEYKLKRDEKREHTYTNNKNFNCIYYELYKDNNIKYACSYCDYVVSKQYHNNIMRHFNRTKKCYIKNDKQLIEQNEMKYYKCKNNRIDSFTCFYCNYTTFNRQHIIRHFIEAKHKCYVN